DYRATRRAPATAVRFAPELRKRLDEWAGNQDDKPSRSEAICRLVAIGLSAKVETHTKSKNAKRRPETRQRARKLAGETMDELADATPARDARAHRKKRLVDGPEELQQVRHDRPNRQ